MVLRTPSKLCMKSRSAVVSWDSPLASSVNDAEVEKAALETLNVAKAACPLKWVLVIRIRKKITSVKLKKYCYFQEGKKTIKQETTHSHVEAKKKPNVEVQRTDGWLPEVGGGRNGWRGSRGTNFQL